MKMQCDPSFNKTSNLETQIVVHSTYPEEMIFVRALMSPFDVALCRWSLLYGSSTKNYIILSNNQEKVM